MEKIPEEIANKILLRLPIKSLLRCRRLCTSWRNLTRESGFVNDHLNLSSQRNPSLILNGTTCRDSADYRSQLYFAENEETSQFTCQKVKFELPNFQEFRVLGSCNGLLCLVHPTNRYVIYICNPCTGKYVNIPEPVSLLDRPGNMVVGFGVNTNTNEYKVIAIVDFQRFGTTDASRSHVFVHTLGDVSWRLKENTPVLNLGQSTCSVFVNRALHWVSNCTAKLIVSFDVAAEMFGDVQRPELELGQGSYTLGVFNERLSILNTSFDDRIEIWVMNDYGVVESWTRTFTINHHQIGRNISQIKTVCFLQDGKVLLLFRNRALLCYNFHTTTASELDIDGLPELFEAVAHVGSLVSPPRTKLQH